MMDGGLRMRAFRIEAPGVAAITEVPEVAGGAGEALLRVKMVGLCGTDLSTFRGTECDGRVSPGAGA
jgi:threonine dehydrogenase-like Zn-dependent dehydrogenase